MHRDSSLEDNFMGDIHSHGRQIYYACYVRSNLVTELLKMA